MSAPTLPVHEVFHTFQGEGVHMGKRAFFIRLFGCPLHCPWCDSAGTWHPDYVPKQVNRLTAEQLAVMAQESGAGIVVITGGEPAIHDLNELTLLLRLNGLRVHLETSGSFHLKGSFDWITVSPKHSKNALPSVMEVASEFKLIIEKAEDIAHWVKFIEPYRNADAQVWLHPEWSQRANPQVLNPITAFVTSFGNGVFRAGYQMHKLYRADALDNRSAPLAPLGGNPDKGF